MARALAVARDRGRRGSSFYAVYLLALSVGNHLLALLAGPALIVFLASVLHRDPAGDAATQRRQRAPRDRRGRRYGRSCSAPDWGAARCSASAFSPSCCAGASPCHTGELRFGALALLLAAAGVSTYAFLYIRAGQHPIINEAAPATWDALVDVIRRAQYPARTPLDDPTVAARARQSRPQPCGSSDSSSLNYVQYFDWQWARSLDGLARLAGHDARGVPRPRRARLYAQRRVDRRGVLAAPCAL